MDNSDQATNLKTMACVSKVFRTASGFTVEIQWFLKLKTCRVKFYNLMDLKFRCNPAYFFFFAYRNL